MVTLMTNSLGSFDPNVLPMDAFSLEGASGDALRVIGLKEPWIFGTAVASAKWTLGVGYAPGDVVYHDEDGLVYMNLVATSTIEPDYSDTGVEGVTWKWVAGSISGFVSGRGRWTKLAGGTLIQHHLITGVSASLYNQNIGTYGWSYYAQTSTTTWTFPLEFYDAAYSGGGSANTGSAFLSIVSTSAANVNFKSTAPNTTDIGVFAIGRWKA